MPGKRTLSLLQRGLHFGMKYSASYAADPRKHKHVAHALVHLTKAVGKIAGVVDELDHHDDAQGSLGPSTRPVVAKALADLVICATRIAREYPGGPIDLDAAVWARAAEKTAWIDPSDDARDAASWRVPATEHTTNEHDDCVSWCAGCRRVTALARQIEAERAKAGPRG
jgi:hypothetical protein